MSKVQRILFSLALLHGACLYADSLTNANTPLENSNPVPSVAVTPIEAPALIDASSDAPLMQMVSERHTVQETPKESKPLESCVCDVRPYKVELRHIEGKGVGYSKGYSTLEMYYMPSHGRFTPIVDLRGHVFDDGKFAANAGIGLRYLDTQVWGINVFYDYRQTKKRNYNQLSLGLESLGRWFDYRINGYFPVGRKHSNYYHTRFSSFKENNILLSRKREFAMTGANAEMGFHMYEAKQVNLYGALGPYYFGGEEKNAWGGGARVALTVYDYITIQGSTSYDNVFNWIGQGELRLNFSFGPRKKIKNSGKRTCPDATIMYERAAQRIDRDEIIVVDHKRKHSAAIDPATGMPYFVVFVNNTGSINGTFESPYRTLNAAQINSGPNNIIYVFPGDGTTNGMNAGITLQNGQMLLGSGVAHTISTQFGNVTIPALSSNYPSITAPTNTSVIIAASNNTISGLSVFSINAQGVQASNGGTITVINNHFNSDSSGGGVELTGTNNAIINNNTFTNVSTGIVLINGSGTYVFDDNLITLGIQSGSIGIATSLGEPNTFNATIANNNISNGEFGITVTTTPVMGSATSNVSVLNNVISHTTSNAIFYNVTGNGTLFVRSDGNIVSTEIPIEVTAPGQVFLSE